MKMGDLFFPTANNTTWEGTLLNTVKQCLVKIEILLAVVVIYTDKHH